MTEPARTRSRIDSRGVPNVRPHDVCPYAISAKRASLPETWLLDQIPGIIDRLATMAKTQDVLSVRLMAGADLKGDKRAGQQTEESAKNDAEEEKSISQYCCHVASSADCLVAIISTASLSLTKRFLPIGRFAGSE
jgi:hypothetical protein